MAMLGDILRGLADPAEAEAALAELGDAAVVERVRGEARAAGVTTGVFVAQSVRHALDHATEDVWLDLLGAMGRSPQPGVVALGFILARALPEKPATAPRPRGSGGRGRSHPVGGG